MLVKQRGGLEAREEYLSSNHADLAFTKMKLARLLLAIDKGDEASVMALSAYDVLVEHAISPPDRAKEAAELLLVIHRAAGNLKQVEKWESVVAGLTTDGRASTSDP